MRQEANNHIPVLDRAVELQQLGFVASGVMHDFNNLLTSILSETGMALLEIPPDSAARDCVERVEKAAQYAARLTGSLMAYVNGKGAYLQTIDLNLLTTDTVTLLHSSFKHVDFQLNLTSPLPRLRVVEGHIQQVVLNLLMNAAQAARSIVQIRTGESFIPSVLPTGGGSHLPSGKYLFLQVMDDGVGIPKDLLPHIFDPFVSTRFHGQGLGLATVVNILAQYGGGVVVENQADSRTSFTAYLPCTSQTMCIG
ncbi:MAG: hypothetical protein IAE79_26715 [Anaerolinea sp.]|nr:hypothetical protein [Anaerolinea sp.]